MKPAAQNWSIECDPVGQSGYFFYHEDSRELPLYWGYKPKEGFVPTKDVAIKIAVAVWEPIYGAEHIAAEKPYQARLTNGVWIIEGSLPHGRIGGVAEARISKDDGKILTVSHGQ